ncbi:phosphoglycerate mutase family protein [Niveispirillum sp. KHB5.9]|uniref:phosphoglycerate mutase family protein n=1 Tax=Niveispirillum sp. KHB5.9 TaxID=3400269 RepID=UPI003A89660C
MLLAALLLSLPVAAQEIILVRHAEKGTEPAGDVALSTDGTLRAKALADLLAKAPPVIILTSPARRTRETAAPTAELAGVPAEAVPIPPGDLPAHVRATVEKLALLRPGEVALVVGHGNTVPAILKALGGPGLPDMPECAYDRVLRWDVLEKSLRVQRYGVKSACPLAE